MKVLKLSILLSALFSSLYSGDSFSDNLDTYISDVKTEMFEYDYKKNKEDALMLRDAWVKPVTMSYSYSKSNPYDAVQLNENAAIRVDQPIFRGGGIFYGVDFASASKEYADYSVDIAKRKMIKNAIATLMQIKQTDLKIHKQNLQIQNSEINLELKKEQYLNGQLDSGFLDSAVIERNTVHQSLYDIQTSKERLVSQFNVLSDLDYKTAKIPHLELINKDTFLKHNLSVEVARSQALRDKENKGVIRSKYLPTISITAGYSWTKTDSKIAVFGSPERNYYDYGMKASLPLELNTFRDIQVAKLSHLKSELSILDKQKEIKALYEQVMQNIRNLEKKKSLSLSNIDIYAKLLKDTKELYRAGYKTKYDVQTLENSLEMSEVDSLIYELDIQLELLNLYEMYANE